MKVKLIKHFAAQYDCLTRAFNEEDVYDVLSIEKGWYRIYTELDDDYLFPPEFFEIVDDTPPSLITN